MVTKQNLLVKVNTTNRQKNLSQNLNQIFNQILTKSFFFSQPPPVVAEKKIVTIFNHREHLPCLRMGKNIKNLLNTSQLLLAEYLEVLW